MTLLTGLDHVQIEAPAGCEAAARQFFTGVLGLPELSKPPILAARGGCWFGLPDGRQLHVGVAADFQARHKGHPALRCADLGAVGQQLDTHGVSWQADEEAGVPRLFLQDPWGNRLEIVQGQHPSRAT
ncbi:VOC family protein [Deinococcus sp. Marseille-Q6407]|uniref:VOC family protein n=1 Tax=Deinococcus sp. Marseille-Q6407 TaxID=2969223 RepID=UPI0021C1BC1C|nr:VOC family protein [Deinococcus sp. Marseille-Q6407]